MGEKVVLGLSDGVDSAMAAWLLKQQGWDVEGVYLDITGEKSRQDAMDSAKRLGIPLHIVNIEQELSSRVCVPFAEKYLHGLTPSPCVGCNRDVKLPVLLRYAQDLHAGHIATGHYVRGDGEHLYCGCPENDQSYMFSRLSREQVRRLILPLGEMHKRDVRALAGKLGFTVAEKRDSLENCFIPKGMHYADWLEEHFAAPGRGQVLLCTEVIGEHAGIHRYTVGQRLPMETKGGRYLYVGAIDAGTNTLIACEWDALFTRQVTLKDLSFMTEVEACFRGTIRVRHTRWEIPECTVTIEGDTARVITDTPLRAPAPGQAAALYIGDMLVGGGEVWH